MGRETRLPEVLRSAATLFARNGFAATSVREVAEEARITKAGLYYHIREKEDLLHRICATAIEDILGGVAEVLAAETDPVARLRGVIAVHFCHYRRHPENLAVLNRERRHLPAAPREEIRRLERRYLDVIRGLIRDGQRAGCVRGVDPTLAAFSLLSTLNHMDDWYRPGGAVPPDRMAEHLGDILLGGLIAVPQGATTKEPRHE